MLLGADGAAPSALEFLKMHAEVDDAFVDDFFSLADPDAPNQPSIKVEAAAKWLGVSKYHIIRRLKEAYADEDDYTIRKPEERSRGPARNAVKVVLLSPPCFKRICMEARSDKGARVRDYYAGVEKTLLRYRAEVTQALQRRIRELEANQGPRLEPDGRQKGVMYVIAASETVTDLYKLGRTRNLGRRLASHESARADGLHVRYVVPVDDVEQVESCVKSLLKRNQYRKYKEVYRVKAVQIKKAIAMCDELGIKARKVVMRPARSTRGAGQQKGGAPAMLTYIVFARG